MHTYTSISVLNRNLINNSLCLGIFPESARNSYIFKGGNECEASWYRPITIGFLAIANVDI